MRVTSATASNTSDAGRLMMVLADPSTMAMF
jgi:hypothetical protein